MSTNPAIASSVKYRDVLAVHLCAGRDLVSVAVHLTEGLLRTGRALQFFIADLTATMTESLGKGDSFAGCQLSEFAELVHGPRELLAVDLHPGVDGLIRPESGNAARPPISMTSHLCL